MNYFTNNALCAEGREFLSDRGLSIPVAEKMGVASAKGEIHFPFVSNGEIVRVKMRNMKDKKKMRFSAQQREEIKLPFWNAQIWPQSDFLIVTEGELDAVAIAQLGANKVVSLPNGAASVQSSFKANFEYLQKFELIYICFDMDDAGNKAAEVAKEILPPSKYRRIMLPAKDANDWIREDPTVTLADLQALMLNAAKVGVDEIVHIKDLSKSYLKAKSAGTSTGWVDVDKLLGGVRLQEMTVVTGETGSGKTTFCTNMLYNILKNDPRGCWVNSWEMNYEAIVRKFAGIVLQKDMKLREFSRDDELKFDHWKSSNNVYLNPKRCKADLHSLNKNIELATRVYGVKYILLDHLDYISDTIKSKDLHENIKSAVCGIHDMAMEHDVHIFLIAHLKQKEPTKKLHMDMLKGSSAIKQYADNVILLDNKGQDDLGVPDNRMMVGIPKNRLLGTKGEATLRYDVVTDSYVDNKEFFKGVGDES